MCLIPMASDVEVALRISLHDLKDLCCDHAEWTQLIIRVGCCRRPVSIVYRHASGKPISVIDDVPAQPCSVCKVQDLHKSLYMYTSVLVMPIWQRVCTDTHGFPVTCRPC